MTKHRVDLMAIKESWRKGEKKEGVGRGWRCWCLGRLSCQVVLVLPLGCSPAPATAVGAKIPRGKWVSASCDVTLWFCCTFQNSSVPSMAVPLPEDGRYKGAASGCRGLERVGAAWASSVP